MEFKPGDVALYEINPQYHVPNRPFFDMVELKGAAMLRRQHGLSSKPVNSTLPGTCK